MTQKENSVSSINNLPDKEEVKSKFTLYAMPTSADYVPLVQTAAESRRLAGLDPSQSDTQPGAGLCRDETYLLAVHPGAGMCIGTKGDVAVHIDPDSGLMLDEGALALRPELKLSLELFENLDLEQQKALFDWLVNAENLSSATQQLPSLPPENTLTNIGATICANGDGTVIAITGTELSTIFIYSKTTGNWDTQYTGTPSAYTGRSLSLNRTGNVLAVGVVGRSTYGSVFIYRRNDTDGTWPSPVTVPEPTDPGGNFGIGVSLNVDGTLLAISAPQHQAAGVSNGGAVYLSRYIGNAWSDPADEKLMLAAPEALDNFGKVLALSADGLTLAVAAPGRNSNKGEVTLFHYKGEYWQPQPPLSPPSLSESDLFGQSLSLSDNGDMLAVGCPGHTGNQGAVYLYQRCGDNWRMMEKLLAKNVTAGEKFGQRVSLTGNGKLLAVSSQDGKNDAEEVTGAAWWFSLQNGQWLEREKLLAEDGATSHQFGAGICFSGDGNILSVGASGWDSNKGKVYLYD